jgi:hypothetical protein
MNTLLELPSATAVNAPTQGQAKSPPPTLTTDSVKTGIEINWWAGKAGTVDIRHACVGVAKQSCRISFDQGSPAPRWLEAKAQHS